MYASGQFFSRSSIEQRFKESRIFFADAAVFDVFTFPLLAGDPGAALRRTHTLVITETIAHKYFGALEGGYQEVLGRTVQLEGASRPFTITGVMRDVPRNSHFSFDMFAVYGLSCVALFLLLIACINFMNLATARAAVQAQEIGVRKVLGASVPDLVLLLTRDVARLIGVALFIAGPVAYAAMQARLQNFAYRAPVGPDVFLVTAAIALLVASLSVGYQALRAALKNPVDALRYE